MPVDDHVSAIRQFNRFHTRLVGALNSHLPSTRFSLPQARILYELAHGSDISAADLSDALHVDPGYLSRQIAKLESEGLVERNPDGKNAKRLVLSLSPEGRAEFTELQAVTAKGVASLLTPLSEVERQQLVGSMQRIQRLLDQRKQDRSYIIRNPEPGDIGWITHRHGALYSQEYGFDWTFEALVSRILADFIDNFVPKRERCWIAERDGEIVGSIFAVRQDDETAKLRLLYVEPGARGLGIGGRLVEECIRFTRNCGYKQLVLWTNDVLVSARKIYQAAGFELVAEEPHHSFGVDLMGQNWELDLDQV